MRRSSECTDWAPVDVLLQFGLMLALMLASTNVRAAEAMRQAVLSETESALQVQATPNAVCTLEHETEKGLHIQFDADDRGIVRIYVRPKSKAPPIAIHLTCRGEGGQVTTYPIELSASNSAPSATATPLPTPQPSQERQRPPLQGDLSALSNHELVSRGYPPRPDPERSPALYARWLKNVTRSFRVVTPRLVPHPDIHNSPGERLASPTLPLPPPRSPLYQIFSNQNSPNWSGVTVTNPVGQFFLAVSDWTVPGVTPSGPPLSIVSEWAGLDNGPDIVQAGSNSYSVNLGFWQFTSYCMWVETFPGPQLCLANFNVSPGDSVSLDVFLADENGQTWFNNGDWGGLTPADNTAWFLTYNYTQGEASFPTLPKPANFVGNQAEFIIERPSNANNVPYPLAAFGFNIMNNLWYADSNYGLLEFWPVLCAGYSSFDGQQQYWNMVNKATGDLLAFALGLPTGDPNGTCSIQWFWFNWQ